MTMDVVDISRWQFGITTVYHFIFVPLTIGLAPLALEGLAAFFFESTFLGLWIFGWSRLPRLLHLACIWVVAVAVNVSAFFIIVANSFMQHPVGVHFNPETHRAELTSITALLG